PHLDGLYAVHLLLGEQQRVAHAENRRHRIVDQCAEPGPHLLLGEWRFLTLLAVPLESQLLGQRPASWPTQLQADSDLHRERAAEAMVAVAPRWPLAELLIRAIAELALLGIEAIHV